MQLGYNNSLVGQNRPNVSGVLSDSWLWELGFVLEWEPGIYMQTE